MSLQETLDATVVPSFTKKGQATRSRILATASDLMFEQGVAGTTVEEIQKKAGVSPSQLYHYFGDKASLVRAVIAHQADSTLDQQRPELDQLDTIAGFRAWRDRMVAINEENNSEGGCALGSLASELNKDKDGEDARLDLAGGFERWESPMRDGLRAMQARGVLRPDANPERLATALLSAVEGGTLLSETRRSSEPLKAAIDTVLDYIESLAV